MSPIEYILDPRWETLCCVVGVEHEAPIFLPQDEVARFLKDIKQPYCAISHNALFDACVLAFRYAIHPTALFCTLSMARAVLYHRIPNGRLSLANVLKFLAIREKGETINKMSGVRFRDLQADPGLMMEWTGYATNDLEGCREIFFRLRDEFPASEALVMDRVIKMATRPRLELNVVALNDYKLNVIRHKHELLQAIGASAEPSLLANVDPGRMMQIGSPAGMKSALMSNNQLAELLQQMGVKPPTKISPTTGLKTWAFSKTDQGFQDLLEHDDPDVQAIVAARLGVKTTIEETRAQRLVNIGLATLNTLGKELLPVPLKYSGAHTHRFSGDWLLNLQNLGARKSKEIRRCINAPSGYTIVAVDAAQIEARIVAWLARQPDLLDMFARGVDTYRAFASDIFHVPVDQVAKAQRFVAKTCILGLGFGMSDAKLHRTIVMLAREQGYDIHITQEDCTNWVRTYRRRFFKIPRCWDDLGWLIERMAAGGADGYAVGPCKVEGTTIILPSGLKLYYDNLRSENGEWWYDHGNFTKKLYGGKLLENIVQALDRQQVVDAGLRTEIRARKAGIEDPRVLLNVHDENVYCVPDDQAMSLAELALEDMKTGGPWADGLPLHAEVKTGKNYGELQEIVFP
jgi:DNA polymerase